VGVVRLAVITGYDATWATYYNQQILHFFSSWHRDYTHEVWRTCLIRGPSRVELASCWHPRCTTETQTFEKLPKSYLLRQTF